MDFQDAKKLFADDKIRELAATETGLRFLKLRSLSRKSSLEHLFKVAKVEPNDGSAKGMFVEAFERRDDVPDAVIEKAICALYESERKERQDQEDKLVSELYKLKSFDWGGLHQNSLEKTIVDNYVKKVKKFSTLNDKIENDLLKSMRGYVQCSWYNHWTSILIEDVFRDHQNVLPAVGQVKKIDFFINDVPFDLKVTYLPEGFVKERRKANDARPELTLLKGQPRNSRLLLTRKCPKQG